MGHTGDINGDGKADILFQNTDGTPAVWLMNGLNILSGANVGFNPSPSWYALTTGDYNGDGKSRHSLAERRRHAGNLADERHQRISGANVGFDPGANCHVIPPHHDLLVGGWRTDPESEGNGSCVDVIERCGHAGVVAAYGIERSSR